MSCESIGKIIKKNICEEFTDILNEIETPLYLEIKYFNNQKKQKRQNAINKRWQKVKAEKAGAIQKAESKPATLEENHQQIKADEKELSFKDYKNKFLKPQKVTNLKGGLTI